MTAPVTPAGGPPDQARPSLLVCSPLRLEAMAVRRGLGGAGQVRVTGYGPARSRRQAAALAGDGFGLLAVAGVGGALTDDLTPGDLVVGTEVSDGSTTTRCPVAPLLAGELRRAGLRVTTGPVITVDRLTGGPTGGSWPQAGRSWRTWSRRRWQRRQGSGR